MSTVERFAVHEFGHAVDMVMASAHDEEVARLKAKILDLELKVSDQYVDSVADAVLLNRVITENTHLRSDIDVIGNVLNSSINYAARYLDAHKKFRAHVKRLADDDTLSHENLREALNNAVVGDQY